MKNLVLLFFGLIAIPCRGESPTGFISKDVQIQRAIEDLNNPSLKNRAVQDLKAVGWHAYLPLSNVAKKNAKFNVDHQDLIEDLRIDAIRNAQVFVIGVGKSEAADREVIVKVIRTKSPVRLALSGYESMNWRIIVDNPEKTLLVDVAISGMYKQNCNFKNATHITSADNVRWPDGTPIEFHATEYDEYHYPKMEDTIRRLFSKNKFCFQGRSVYRD
jgi:hypothetical protein